MAGRPRSRPCFGGLPSLAAYRWDLLGALGGVRALHPAGLALRPVGGLGSHRRAGGHARAGGGRGNSVRYAVPLTAMGWRFLAFRIGGAQGRPGPRTTRSRSRGPVKATPIQDLRQRHPAPADPAIPKNARLQSEPFYATCRTRCVDGRASRSMTCSLIGAGNGTDVALALRKRKARAHQREVFEIDPRLQVARRGSPLRGKPYAGESARCCTSPTAARSRAAPTRSTT